MGLWSWSFYDQTEPVTTATSSTYYYVNIEGAQDAFVWLEKWWPLLLIFSVLVIVLPVISYAFFKGARYAMSLVSYLAWIFVKSLFIYMAFRLLEIAAWSAIQGRASEWAWGVLKSLYYFQDQVMGHPVAQDAMYAFHQVLSFFSFSSSSSPSS